MNVPSVKIKCESRSKYCVNVRVCECACEGVYEH